MQSIVYSQTQATENDNNHSLVQPFLYIGVLVGIAFLIGLSFFARQVVGIEISGKNYTPLVYNASSLSTQFPVKSDYNFKPDDILWDETRAYARYTQEILRGEYLGANSASFNPYLTQGSLPENFWYRDRLGPIILALIAKGLGGGSVSNAFIASDFIFPFCIALTLLVLCRRFFGFTLAFSVMATASVMWLDWNNLLHLRDIFWGGIPDGATLLRTPYPQFSFLSFLLFVMALMNFHRQASRAALVFLATTLLVNFYMYFYVWTPVVVMACLYAFINSHTQSATHLLNSKPKYKYFLWATLSIAIAFSFPVWESLLISGGNVFKDSFLRVFGSFTHHPEWRQSLLVLPFLLLAAILKKSFWPTRWVWIIFFTSSLIVLNQQVITGKINQPGHWTGGLIEPFTVLFLFDIAFHFLRRNQVLRKSMSAITILLIFAILIQIYYVSYVGAKVAAPYNRIDTQFSELIAFMNKPERRAYGFLSNDPYLQTILPAYLIQKPLMPWYNDPLSNKTIASIDTALSLQFGKFIGILPYTGDHPSSLKFNENKVLLVLNRRLKTYSSLHQCQILFENNDFIVSIKKCND